MLSSVCVPATPSGGMLNGEFGGERGQMVWQLRRLQERADDRRDVFWNRLLRGLDFQAQAVEADVLSRQEALLRLPCRRRRQRQHRDSDRHTARQRERRSRSADHDVTFAP
jgi:hypothetical protein